MDPILAGFISNVAYDAVRQTLVFLRRRDARNYVENAARSTADEFGPGLNSSDLMSLFEQDGFEDSVHRFKEHGTPISVDELVAIFDEHCVSPYVRAESEEVIERFFENIVEELSSVPELWRRLTLNYIRHQTADIESLADSIEALREELETAGLLASPRELNTTIQTLRRKNFEWLSDEQVYDGRVDRERCWNRVFRFSEIDEGFAIDRYRHHGSRTPEAELSVSNHLFSLLQSGNNVLLSGFPGTGKSTVCRTVAYNWHDDSVGPVLYRESGSDPIETKGDLVGAIQAISESGDVLVVVEDAARTDAILILSVIEDLVEDNITFLLDARWHESEQVAEVIAAHEQIERDESEWERVSPLDSSLVREYELPQLDRREIERFLNHLSSLLNLDVQGSADQIHDSLERGYFPFPDVFEDRFTSLAAVPLLLTSDDEFDHSDEQIPILDTGDDIRSPLRSLDAERIGSLSEDIPLPNTLHVLLYEIFSSSAGPDIDYEDSGLYRNVRAVYNKTETEANPAGIPFSTDKSTRSKIWLLVAILNVLGLPVSRHLLAVLDRSGIDGQEFELALADSRGLVLFGTVEDTFVTGHRLWSLLYLEECLHRLPSRYMRGEFGTVCGWVFDWFSTEAVRTETAEFSDSRSRLADIVSEDPVRMTDAVVAAVFSLGVNYRDLSKLFVAVDGDPDRLSISPPDNCSPVVEAHLPLWKAIIHANVGNFDSSSLLLERWRERVTKLNGAEDLEISTVSALFQAITEYRAGNDGAAENIVTDIVERSGSRSDDGFASIHNIDGVISGQSASAGQIESVIGNIDIVDEVRNSDREEFDAGGISIQNDPPDTSPGLQAVLEGIEVLTTRFIERGDLDRAVRWARTGQSLADNQSNSWLRLVAHRTILDQTDDIRLLYVVGTLLLFRGDHDSATAILTNVWNRRSDLEPNVDDFQTVLSAGVVLLEYVAYRTDDEIETACPELLRDLNANMQHLTSSCQSVVEAVQTEDGSVEQGSSHRSDADSGGTDFTFREFERMILDDLRNPETMSSPSHLLMIPSLLSFSGGDDLMLVFLGLVIVYIGISGIGGAFGRSRKRPFVVSKGMKHNA